MVNRVDPDPWVVTSVVIACVATVAQLVQVGLAWSSRPQPTSPRRALKVVRGHLADATGNCIRRVESIIRILPRLEGVDKNPLEAKFQFGDTTLLISRMALLEYQRQVEALLQDLAFLSHTTLALIGDDEEFAADVGNELARSFANINDRINGFYREAPPIEGVISDCLLVLREFERILMRLEGTN